MVKILVLVLTCFICVENTEANENQGVIDMLVTAKATGMCGVFKQMSIFQESTQMPGGDEFIVRFLNTEAARLGKTLPQFLEQCQTATKRYVDLMSMLESPSK